MNWKHYKMWRTKNLSWRILQKAGQRHLITTLIFFSNKLILSLGCFTLLAMTTSFSTPIFGKEIEKQTFKSIDSKSIKNLDGVLKKTEETLGALILFPTVIRTLINSEGRNQYYVTLFIQSSKKEVILSIYATADEHGDRDGLLVAEITVRKRIAPEMKTNRFKEPITELVHLKDNVEGYYTPAYSRATYVPHSIQWEYKGMLYKLEWREGDEEDSLTNRENLIKMANSAILDVSHKKEAD